MSGIDHDNISPAPETSPTVLHRLAESSDDGREIAEKLLMILSSFVRDSVGKAGKAVTQTLPDIRGGHHNQPGDHIMPVINLLANFSCSDIY